MRSIARRRTPGNRRNRPRLMVVRLGDPSHPSSTFSSASIGGTSHPASSATLCLSLAGKIAAITHALTICFSVQTLPFMEGDSVALNRCVMIYPYGSISTCSSDQGSVQWAGTPPSGANMVGYHMRSLRTRHVRSVRTKLLHFGGAFFFGIVYCFFLTTLSLTLNSKRDRERCGG
jgi:hypothetical protein